MQQFNGNRRCHKVGFPERKPNLTKPAFAERFDQRIISELLSREKHFLLN